MNFGTSRIVRLVAAAAMILVFASASGATSSYANLAPSTFESNDGNMLVNTAGNKDWANAPSLTTATDYPSGTKTDNSFTTGSKEDDLSPVVGIAGVPPNKNDLINFYTGNETVSGNTFLYLAFTRALTSGNADVDFEVNHVNVGTTPSNNGTCLTGYTAENGVCVPLQRTDGDALFQFIFPGGGGPITSLQIWRWATSTSSTYFQKTGLTNNSGCLSTSAGPPCWSGGVLADGSEFDGASNTGAINNPLDPTCSGTCLATATFGEAAVNLNTSGIFPSGTCTHFGGAWAKSRSSDSGSSALQDVIAPVPTNISNCGSVKIIKHTDPRGLNQSFSYTSTLSGAQLDCSTDTTPSSFTLNDNGNTSVDNAANTETCANVPIGRYTVTEGNEPAGFTLENLICTATRTGSGIQDAPGSPQADIVIASGLDTVTCTYTNQGSGAITVTKTGKDKNCTSAGTPTITNGTCTGSAAAALSGASFTVNGVTKSTGADGTACFGGLTIGTAYTVTENSPPAGYANDSASKSVTVNGAATCSSGTPTASSFSDSPLTDLTASATSEVAGATNSTINCVDSGSHNVASSGSNADPATASATSLKPGTYTCTVVIDP